MAKVNLVSARGALGLAVAGLAGLIFVGPGCDGSVTIDDIAAAMVPTLEALVAQQEATADNQTLPSPWQSLDNATANAPGRRVTPYLNVVSSRVRPAANEQPLGRGLVFPEPEPSLADRARNVFLQSLLQAFIDLMHLPDNATKGVDE